MSMAQMMRQTTRFKYANPQINGVADVKEPIETLKARDAYF